MTIKKNGGIFGRNPTYYNVEVENDLRVGGDLIINGETVTGLDFEGSWDASTNTPDVTASPTVGQFWIVSVAGSTDLSGITTWDVGDWALYDGSAWQRVEGGGNGTFTSVSVSGTSNLDGAVVINESGADVNFRVESDTNDNAFFLDGATGNVGVGKGGPTAKVHVEDVRNVLTDISNSANYHLLLANDENNDGEAVGVAFAVSSASETSAGASIYHTREGSGSYGSLCFATKPSGGSVTEAMRIDDSGNLLVGKTATTRTDVGAVFGPTVNRITLDGLEALELIRNTSDGDILHFFKDNTQVGSIGTLNSNTYFGNGAVTLLPFDSLNAVLPRGTDGAQRDAAIDLGTATNRFKDFYLSGGLPGTASGSLVINENGVDSDFRVESDNNNSALFVDAGNDRIIFGVKYEGRNLINRPAENYYQVIGNDVSLGTWNSGETVTITLVLATAVRWCLIGDLDVLAHSAANDSDIRYLSAKIAAKEKGNSAGHSYVTVLSNNIFGAGNVSVDLSTTNTIKIEVSQSLGTYNRFSVGFRFYEIGGNINSSITSSTVTKA